MTRNSIYTFVALTILGISMMALALPGIVFAGNVNLTATPATDPLYTGGDVTLTWNASDTFRCVGTGFSTGGNTSGTVVVRPYTSGTKTYSIACYDQSPSCTLTLKGTQSLGSGGTASNTCVAPTINYSPNGSCYPKWASCSVTNRSGGRYVEGEGYIGSTYTRDSYRCEGGCSTVTDSVSVRVLTPPPPPNPQVTLSFSPQNPTPGDSVLLSWDGVRALTCRGTGFSTNGATSGSITVTPSENTTYSITCDSEVFSSNPGTWEYQSTDYTDYWCPVSDAVFNQTYDVFPDCPTNNLTINRRHSEFGTTRIQNGDPTGLSCTGSERCKLNSNSGCVVVSEIYQCNGGASPNQITDSITVVTNELPNIPTILGPTSGVEGETYTFTMQAIDLDGDDVRYRIDWNPNSGIDENSSYNSSNWLYSTTRSWSSPGTYSFRVRTQDENDGQSGYATHTITIGSGEPQCNDGIDNDGDGLIDLDDYGCSGAGDSSESPNPQCSDGIDNDSDGLIDYPDDPGCVSLADTTESPNPQCSDGIDNDGNGLIDLADTLGCDNATDNNESTPEVEADITFTITPALVRSGNPVNVSWTATDVTSCTVAGSNGDNWSGTSGNETSSNITAETTYVIVCEETDGDTASDSKTVKLVPSFEEVFRSLPATLASAFGAVLRF